MLAQAFSYGRDENLGIIRSPGFTAIDLGLIRDFHFSERFRLNAQVGSINSTLNPERQNQFALKLYFRVCRQQWPARERRAPKL